MTSDEAALIVEKFDILGILEDDERLLDMADLEPETLDALYALVRLAGF